MKITQNQYINKSKSSKNTNNWEIPSTINYSCDISNGYIQAKNLSLFNGASEEMDCGGNSTFDCAYLLLSNPKKSNVNIYVKSSVISNLSSSPVISKIYYCVEDVIGNLESSSNTTITNSNSCGSMPTGNIFFGNDIEKIYGIYGQNLIIPPYSMHISNENGGVVISPGFSYLFEISPVKEEITSNFVMSFSWWEEPLSSFFD
ncbi:hypothetical protein K0040_11750 [Terrisporobacter petrolearius]|uniref:DUF6143 family protein n=1 Tax=Terrisporobacter petrolearius TaxID=1460447 RepID=UPI001D164BCA|nr:DUF6143 family protein [Terrisporobacter petrolearius]MCC3864948.1 hypothetical protein [Terrisporobacter petrolearius]